MVFESYEIHCFHFVIRIAISLKIFTLKYALTHTISLGILLVAIRRTFDRSPDKLTNCCHGPYMGSVLLHMLFQKYAKEMP